MSDLVKDLTQYRISGIEKAEVEYIPLIDCLNSSSSSTKLLPTKVF